jgi:hypothetical protein
VKFALILRRLRDALAVRVRGKRVRNLLASSQHVKEQIAALVAVRADLGKGDERMDVSRREGVLNDGGR